MKQQHVFFWLILLISIITIAPVCAIANVINIPDDFETIRAGIREAEDGDTVLIAPGTYRENLSFFNKAITIIGDPEHPENIVIDGSGNEISCFLIGVTGELTAAIIGMTLTGGSGMSGGGISCSYTHLLLSDLIIHNNTSNSNGGGIYCGDSSFVELTCSTLRNNTAGLGGGISIDEGSEITISDCVIEENTADGYGGGIRSNQHTSSITITNTRVAFNQSRAYGGGIFLCGSLGNDPNYFITNTTIVNNIARADGGGCYFFSCAGVLEHTIICENEASAGGGIFYGGNIQIFNCTICNNQQDQGEIAIETTERCVAEVKNSIIRNPGEVQMRLATGEFAYNDITNGQDGIIADQFVDWGDGNIDEDPLFVDSDNGDYNLTADSPCIDAGDTESPFDADFTRSDIGALHYHQRDIAVGQNELLFEPVEMGDEDSLTVSIVNTGNTPLIFEMRRSRDVESGNFILRREGEEITLEGLEELVVWVVFHPVEVGLHETQFRIASNDPDEQYIYVALIGDVLQDVDQSKGGLPSNFALTSVYPNPFNSTTTIGYSLPTAGMVSLAVYDLSGREVARLVEGAQPAGTHEVVWTADGVNSGVYVVTLDVGGVKLGRKVVIIK